MATWLFIMLNNEYSAENNLDLTLFQIEFFVSIIERLLKDIYRNGRRYQLYLAETVERFEKICRNVSEYL
jgi:hypothetical protein